MKCTMKEQMTCNVEKLGCKGCYYDDRTTYIHYGSKHFDKNLFKEIKNIPFVKPEGGLWASREDSENGWKEWTERNKFNTDKYSEDNYFKFKLKNNARILTLKTKNDLEKLPKIESKNIPSFCEWLDFEKIAEKYDAIEVFIKELYWDMYGWDCDSILILNENVVEEMEE